MKATLTIEVPDDFIKGEYYPCPLAGDEYQRYCVIGGRCEPDNCPLEIQENNND